MKGCCKAPYHVPSAWQGLNGMQADQAGIFNAGKLFQLLKAACK